MKKYSFAFLMLIATMSMAFFACTPSKSGKHIGLQLYSLRDDMQKDPVITLAEVGKMGYASVEAAGYSDGMFYGMKPADFKALVEKNNMTFRSSHTGRAVPDSASWQATMEWWDACIAAHVEAGVSYIVQPFMDSVGYTSLAGVQRYCDYFNAVGEKCLAKGIRFGYHNHDAEFSEVEGQVIYDYMLQHTDSSKVFFQLDLYWIYRGGKNAVDYFTLYPGRFPLWHVKDEKELGASGKIDFKPIYENAALAGLEYAIVEQEEYTTTPLEGVKQSLEFMLNADYVK
jgi:sugar phosphate isomerase/epimerase